MKFSVITPSYLGSYRTAAKDRDKKILRAVDSVLNQTFQDFELIVIADGCEQTIEIMSGVSDEKIKTFLIPKTKLWSGEPRNTGIERADGEFITYLDIDDVFGEHHLENISKSLNGYDWVWFDDVRYSVRNDAWYENPCDIHRPGYHGTSNVCHKRSLSARWDKNGYAHDFYFIKNLLENPNYAKIQGGEYYVCHIPDNTLMRGYEL